MKALVAQITLNDNPGKRSELIDELERLVEEFEGAELSYNEEYQ